MSVSRAIYFGPYFKCQTRTEQVDSFVHTCTNAKCVQHGSHVAAPFCQFCGSPTKDLTVKEEGEAPHWGDVVEMLNDVLMECSNGDADFDDGFHYWVPNVYETSPRDFGIDDSGAYPVVMNDVASEQEWLVQTYAKELEILRREYGDGNVTVEWGVLRYCY